jgi:hypothetical protein
VYPDPANESAAGDRYGARGHEALLLTVLSRLGPVLEITLVSNEHRREIAPLIDLKGLLMELAGFLERFPRGYRVHKGKSSFVAHVFSFPGST